MKRIIRNLLTSFLLCMAIFPQSFTKVTNEIVSNDGGDSRSVNWIDYDNDLDLDLFVSNSGSTTGQNEFLYQNQGNGTFIKIIDGIIVNDGGRSDGSSWGDYDNDGYVDAALVNWYNENNYLYKNAGDGSFNKITQGAVVNDHGYSETCAWGDFDNDGFIDLFVSNSGSPNGRNFLYRNNGDNSFTKISDGIVVEDNFLSRGVSWADYDNDGDVDLFVANESNQNNSLYQNNSDGTFTKITEGDIVSDGGESMSGSWGDYDNDGDLDLFVSNISDQNNFLYRNDGLGNFTKITEGDIVANGGWSFGSSWCDYDNDGDLDLFVTNGWGPNQTTTHPNFLYENNGNGTFTKITDEEIVTDLGWSYGAAWGDYDSDGDQDVFVAKWHQGTEDNVLYQNNGNSNHWINILLKGTDSNASGLGAKVFVKTHINNNPVWQMREVTSQSGYCSQNSLNVEFGLGNSSIIDSIIIRWPSGLEEIFTNVGIDQFITITEGGGISSLEDSQNKFPSEFQLAQNYPNPFNPNTTINFSISKASFVSLKIFNLIGEDVETLVANELNAGDYKYDWNAKDYSGGIYFYRLQSSDYVETKKMILIK